MAAKPAKRMTSVGKLCEYASHGLFGRQWYIDATAQIDWVASQEGWCPTQFAGVLATTSPRCAVVRNIRMSLHFMHFRDERVIPMRGIRKSLRTYLDRGAIHGPKTGPFFQNLRGNPYPVTLDVWMAYALGIDQKDFSLVATHSKATERVRQVARLMGLTPAECQASIWTGYRHLRGLAHSPFEVAGEYLKARKNGWKIEGCKLHDS